MLAAIGKAGEGIAEEAACARRAPTNAAHACGGGPNAVKVATNAVKWRGFGWGGVCPGYVYLQILGIYLYLLSPSPWHLSR